MKGNIFFHDEKYFFHERKYFFHENNSRQTATL